jgi:hypothetical protein
VHGRQREHGLEWLKHVRSFVRQEDKEMLAALSLGFMLAIWVIVIWGAIHFNHNVQ